MASRIPPALRRHRFTSHLLASVGAIGLIAATLAGEELIEFASRAELPGFSADRTTVSQRQEARAVPVSLTGIALMPGVEQAEPPPVATHTQIVEQLRTAEVPATQPVTPRPLVQVAEGIELAEPDYVAALPADLSALPIPISIPVPRATVPGIPEADVALIKQALAEYRRGKIADGDALAAQARSETAKLALEWSVIRLSKQAAGFNRIAEFARNNPDMPMSGWVESRAADALFVQKVPADKVLAFFGDRTPDTSAGKVALARALAAKGETKKAEALVRAAYRDDKTNVSMRDAIARDFPGLISTADQRYLAERLIYEGQSSAGLAIAKKAGANTAQLAQLLTAAIAENGAVGGLLDKLDPALRNEPAALFSRAQHMRRASKFTEAAQALIAAPTDPNKIVDGDEWWVERRMLTRKLLDSGETDLAYKVAAGHAAETSGHIVDAEVHAGWIALRFQNEPAVAAAHFAKARAAAETPASLARADYWQGRAAEALEDPFASNFHAEAATHRQTFYGQLALAKIGQGSLPEALNRFDDDSLRAVAHSRAMRVIRALLDTDARDLAQPLIFDYAKRANDTIDVVVLGDLLAQYRLPKLTLQAGKIASLKGLLSEEHAFPTFGIPEYEPATQSAESAIVYSIARQESEFDASVISHAGARGLMQLMPATAMRTANRQKMQLDVNRLTTDPALNAKIGAAHLAELFGEYNGSYLLSFAAYNAGGRRVKEWTTAYGDPRDPNVDKVDWIERIPITETRNYVQKIMENVQVYRARLYGQRQLGIMSDMERGARSPRAQLAPKVSASATP